MQTQKNSIGNLLPTVFTWNTSKQSVRVQIINNQPHFIAKDVCAILSISNDRDAISRLDDDERGMSVVPTSSGYQSMNTINESGLYSLIFQSRKVEAKAFRKWVTSEVLPALRRTGKYCADNRGSDFIDLRGELYEITELGDSLVRRIYHGGQYWYSVNDILRSVCISTRSSYVARSLNIKRENAIKIFVHGNNHPAWFANESGMKMIVNHSSIIKKSDVKLLAGGQK